MQNEKPEKKQNVQQKSIIHYVFVIGRHSVNLTAGVDTARITRCITIPVLRA